jgi:hypothetical protein
MSPLPPCPVQPPTTAAHRQAVLQRIQDVWARHPQLRLAQLIANVYPDSHNMGGRRPDWLDAYDRLDAEFVRTVEEFYAPGAGQQPPAAPNMAL